jgi:hypothetical protein
MLGLNYIPGSRIRARLYTWIQCNVRTMFLDPMLGLDCVSRYNVRAGLCIWILCWGWNGDPMLWLDSVSGSHVGHVNGSKVGCTMFLDPMFGMFLDPKLVGLCFWIPCYGGTVYLNPFSWLDDVPGSNILQGLEKFPSSLGSEGHRDVLQWDL